jgi:hypothetical protein
VTSLLSVTFINFVPRTHKTHFSMDIPAKKFTSGSNLGPKTSYPVSIFVVFSVLPGNCWDSNLKYAKTGYYGRATAQVVNRGPLNAEARFRARFNPCGIYCG